MTQTVVRAVDVYPYRGRHRDVEFLLLRRSSDVVYAGSWRMVGGKITDGETAWEAGLRELREETGMDPETFWSIPSANTFYEWEHDRLNLIPAFAAKISGEPVLDREHDLHAWVDVDAAAERLEWPEQQRLLRLSYRLIIHGIPPELVVRIE